MGKYEQHQKYAGFESEQTDAQKATQKIIFDLLQAEKLLNDIFKRHKERLTQPANFGNKNPNNNRQTSLRKPHNR